MTPELAHTMARYNTWMNGKLNHTCLALSDAEVREDCGAYFKSIWGTLNHLYIADSLWMARFTQRDGEYTDLSALVFADWAAWWHARQTLDAEIETWVGTLTAEYFQETLH